ncbi:MAG: hypothetical protein HOJ85_15515 [Ilumatobacter sp.]|uniref:hypothetical protein n=3 Tax=Ilumatobacter sp. TaxID=1967498 RepID=UPI001D6B24B0|nr:hypothetical protein [Ilumatobacter sp.]MBT5276003.1 hypothetical protein [Ilumatobacter sp.]MBT5555159.1 hypothetical protein [Ilumatobacter sp.]MBT5866636.1 hypothetical protein [Ilumatobacter sp.]MBT7430025.1 hypothetical protein [Ilumatobacter sp.]
MVKQQSEDCDSEGEPYGPSAVDIVLDNPEVALRQVGRDDPIVTWAPSAADLFDLGEGFFLDFPGSSLSPECIYERDFNKYTADEPATVYAHIVQPSDAPGKLVVQYWTYWYYNDWNNKHESDWEGISLLFDASSIDEALAATPIEIGYSQHEGGERATWDSNKLERDGDHPLVYSSAGSHASYFGAAVFLGRGASEGFGCDDTSGPSDSISPEVVLLPDAVDDPDDPLAWVSFEGRWGERQRGPFNGPTGPASKDRWLDPLPWFDELRPSSVVIPAGDSEGATVVEAFCGVVAAGSNALITFTVSPAAAIIGFLIIFSVLKFIAGRTDWTRVSAEPLRRRRRVGQIIRAALVTYRGSPLLFIALGLLYLPAAAFAAAIAVFARLIPFVGEFIELARPSGGTNLFMAALAGGAVNLAAFVGVSALVAEFLRGANRTSGGLRDATRVTWARRSTLLKAFIRTYATVVILMVSIIGIPWGIRQIVRYQLMPQVIVHEETDARGSLQRSTELVHGRWLHTAFAATAINGMVFVTVMGLSLLLLVGAASIPLWAFSALVTLLYILVAPLAAIAMNLVYGDAVAATQGAPVAELVSVD